MKKSMIFVSLLAVGFSNAQVAENLRGRVGINTTKPSATLNVKSLAGRTTSATKTLEVENGASTKLLTVLDNGNVGIGTDNPTTTLDIITQNETAIKIKHNGLDTTSGGEAGKSSIDFLDKNNKVFAYLGDYDDTWANFSINTYYGNLHMGAYNSGDRSITPTKSSLIEINPSNERRMVFSIRKENDYGVTLVNDKGYWGFGTYVTKVTDVQEQLTVRGGIKLYTEGTKYDVSTISNNSTNIKPDGGAGTMIFQNGHFYGWIDDTNGWKQLDNDYASSNLYTADGSLSDNRTINTNGKNITFTGQGNIGIGATPVSEKLEVNGKIKASNVIFTGIPTYNNDTDAGTGGLVAGEMYKTTTGELRIKL